jgi:hypothetical protein
MRWFRGFGKLELILLSSMSTNSAGTKSTLLLSITWTCFTAQCRSQMSSSSSTSVSTSWIIALTVDLSSIDLKLASSGQPLVATITDQVLIFRPTHLLPGSPLLLLPMFHPRSFCRVSRKRLEICSTTSTPIHGVRTPGPLHLVALPHQD